jgi:hypothetical protein
LQIIDMEVKGHTQADMSVEEDLFGVHGPVLVINGREVSWAEFCQMRMTFEGFQDKLEIAERGDDLENWRSRRTTVFQNRGHRVGPGSPRAILEMVLSPRSAAAVQNCSVSQIVAMPPSVKNYRI